MVRGGWRLLHRADRRNPPEGGARWCADGGRRRHTPPDCIPHRTQAVETTHRRQGVVVRPASRDPSPVDGAATHSETPTRLPGSESGHAHPAGRAHLDRPHSERAHPPEGHTREASRPSVAGPGCGVELRGSHAVGVAQDPSGVVHRAAARQPAPSGLEANPDTKNAPTSPSRGTRISCMGW